MMVEKWLNLFQFLHFLHQNDKYVTKLAWAESYVCEWKELAWLF